MSLALFPPRVPSRHGNQPETFSTTLASQKNNSNNSNVSLQPIELAPPSSFRSRNNSRSSSPQRPTSSSGSHSLSFRSRKNREISSILPDIVFQQLPAPPVQQEIEISPRTHSTIENNVTTSPARRSPTPTRQKEPVKTSYLAGAKLRAKEAFTRRKASSNDLDSLATVEEFLMDSPTIPGRPAMFDRQSSLPAKRSLTFTQDEAQTLRSQRSISDIHIRDTTCKNTLKERLFISSATPVNPASIPLPTPGNSPIEEHPPAVPPKEATKFLPFNINKSRSTSRPRAGSAPVKSNNPQVTDDKRVHHKQQASASRLEEIRQEQVAANLQDKPTKIKRKSTTYRTIPRGIRPAEASKVLQPVVLNSLQSAAKKTSEKFGVLAAKDVDLMTQELAQLETRCNYLRKTHISLKSGRRALHTKMLQHLRSERSTGFSQFTLLKQQEALCELDASIDDWESKLERAEARRAVIHRKLLEHVAAALSVRVDARSNSQLAATPPATPPDNKKFNTRADRLQSITIYALADEISSLLLEREGNEMTVTSFDH